MFLFPVPALSDFITSTSDYLAPSLEYNSNAGKDIKGMSRDNVREVGDYSNAVPGIGGLVGRSVSRQHGMRKSRGRVRT
jgi:hypothetical protein